MGSSRYWDCQGCPWALSKYFIGVTKVIPKEALQCIPRIVIEEKNMDIQYLPNMDEVKQVVFVYEF